MKNKLKLFLWISVLIFALSLVIVSIIVLNWKNELFLKLLAIIGTIGGIIVAIISSLLLIQKYSERNLIVKNSFNNFLDNLVSANLLGMVVYDLNNIIIWTNKFIRKRFGNEWIGKTLDELFKSLNLDLSNFSTNENQIDFKHKNDYYTLNINKSENTLSIKDITLEKNALFAFIEQSNVIGELEIDNFNLYQAILTEEEFFNINVEIAKVLDSLVAKYNFVYRQYNSSGKYLILTDKNSLNEMEKENFGFFKALHDIQISKTSNNILISVSVGFAEGTNNFKDKIEQAKSALMQAQNRGGDQVAIFSNLTKPRYFGSTKEILPSINLTKVKAISKLIEQKLKNQEIQNVIIYGHKNADLDAVGAALGIQNLAKYFNKEAFICSETQDLTTKNAINEIYGFENELFIKPKLASKLTTNNSLIFLVDTAIPERTDNEFAFNNSNEDNIFVIDHHRLSKPLNYGLKENKLIEQSASSASELVGQILMMINPNIKLEENVAQMLLNGIYLDTQQFQKHTSGKTFQIAAWLETKGANSTKSAQYLKMNALVYKEIYELLDNLEEVKPGFYLAYKDVALSSDVISLAAEEVLRIRDRKASFVVAYSEEEKAYKLSARGIDTNVQIICEQVGGGGHFGTAAASSDEDLETFVDNIKQAIVGVKYENYSN
ncbi:DHH family phosphoesterase [Mycoplasmopsis gallinarum]